MQLLLPIRKLVIGRGTKYCVNIDANLLALNGSTVIVVWGVSSIFVTDKINSR